MNDYPRGRDVSQSLTEVRTVLSRAETALADVLGQSYAGNVLHPVYARDPQTGRYGWTGDYHPASGEQPDPDVEDMYEALEQVVALLDPWRRTGRPRKTR